MGGLPVLVRSNNEFKQIFGGYLSKEQFGNFRFLAYAVEHYFANGGNCCYISRVVPKDAKPWSCTLEGRQLKLTAKSPGVWGNKLRVSFTPLLYDKFDIRIGYVDTDIAEVYSGVSFNADDPDYIVKKLAKSEMINIEVNSDIEQMATSLPQAEEAGASQWIRLMSGSDGSIEGIDASVFIGGDQGPGKRTGLNAFLDNWDVSILAIPGITDLEVQQALIAHCDNLGSRFAILDLPQGQNSVADIQANDQRFDSPNAAIYHPWIQVFDPLMKQNVYAPPSGAVAGIYVRVDNERGVHKPSSREKVRYCTGLEYQYSDEEQSKLNLNRINLIRPFPGEGALIWGSRTCSSDLSWKYVNVRRLFIFLEESIKRGTEWVAFQSNNMSMWQEARSVIEDFLIKVWKSGALVGSSPEEAFYVKAGLGISMTPTDILDGQFICLIGMALMRPAEFITLRLVYRMVGR